jgi:hypothetical protein
LDLLRSESIFSYHFAAFSDNHTFLGLFLIYPGWSKLLLREWPGKRLSLESA